MIKKVFFKDKKVTIIDDLDNYKDIDVGATIYKVIFTEKHVVILLSWEDLYHTELHNRNIICLDKEGKMLWRIVNQDTLSLSKEKTFYSWTSLELKNNNCVRIGTFSGMEVDADINSGKFISRGEFTK